MDLTVAPIILIFIVLIGLGIASFINPKIFYTKIKGKNKSKGNEYEVGPAVPLAQRVWGLVFAIIAFFMLLAILQNLPRNP